jgi:hypothetical protein
MNTAMWIIGITLWAFSLMVVVVTFRRDGRS